MKTIKKLISVILVISLVLTIPLSVRGYSPKAPGKAPAVSSSAVYNIMEFFRPLGKTYELLFSRKIPPIEFKESAATELCQYILDNASLDIISIIQNVPVKASLLETGYKLTNADTTAIRESVYALRDEAYAEGDSTKGFILYLLGAYISVIEEVEVFTVPYGEEGGTRVALTATFMDGTTETVYTEIFFTADGYVYGPGETGMQKLGYECSVYDLMIYATVDSWMRDFGFCFFYDFICYTTPFFNYTTRRYKFEYDGKEWMIQAWKGNYLIANGAEVGIYCRDSKRIGTYYDCYDGVMPMTLKLRCGDTVIYDIEKEHWWINAFKLGDGLYSPKKMTVEFSIEMPDEEMAKAFFDSVMNNYRKDSACTLDGTKVNVIW